MVIKVAVYRCEDALSSAECCAEREARFADSHSNLLPTQRRRALFAIAIVLDDEHIGIFEDFFWTLDTVLEAKTMRAWTEIP